MLSGLPVDPAGWQVAFGDALWHRSVHHPPRTVAQGLGNTRRRLPYGRYRSRWDLLKGSRGYPAREAYDLLMVAS